MSGVYVFVVYLHPNLAAAALVDNWMGTGVVWYQLAV